MWSIRGQPWEGFLFTDLHPYKPYGDAYKKLVYRFSPRFECLLRFCTCGGSWRSEEIVRRRSWEPILSYIWVNLSASLWVLHPCGQTRVVGRHIPPHLFENGWLMAGFPDLSETRPLKGNLREYFCLVWPSDEDETCLKWTLRKSAWKQSVWAEPICGVKIREILLCWYLENLCMSFMRPWFTSDNQDKPCDPKAFCQTRHNSDYNLLRHSQFWRQ